ncbi:MAG: hypothetical protein ACK53Y_14195 [bacterium]
MSYLTLEQIPASLRSTPQWVAWRYITRDGKATNLMPIRASILRQDRSPLVVAEKVINARWKWDFEFKWHGWSQSVSVCERAVNRIKSRW